MFYRIVNTTGQPVFKTILRRHNKSKIEHVPDYSKFFGEYELEDLQEKHKTLNMRYLLKTKKESFEYNDPPEPDNPNALS